MELETVCKWNASERCIARYQRRKGNERLKREGRVKLK
jgi:hypothetical protein